MAGFWSDVATALRTLDIPTTGAFTGVKVRRLVRSLDTDAHASDVKTRFEADVKPPFVSVVGFSTTKRLESGRVREALGDVVDLFPLSCGGPAVDAECARASW